MNYYILTITFISIILSTGCNNTGSGKEHSIKETEKYLCEGNTYASDNEHIRAKGIGASQNKQIARQKARTKANANLAAKVSEYRQKIADYPSGNNNNTDDSSKYSRTVINEQLVNVRIICTETTLKDDIYTVSMIIEMAKSDVILDKEMVVAK